MLTGTRHAGRWRVALAVAVGILVGLAVGRAIDAPDERAAVSAATAPAAERRAGVRDKDAAAAGGASVSSAFDRSAVEAALRRGWETAQAYGGTVEAAVWAPGWSSPVVRGDRERRMRMWSMAKPMTALVAWQFGADQEAIDRALRASENCPQRSLLLGIQQQVGGVGPARRLFQKYWSQVGRGVRVTREAQPADASCDGYLRAHGQDPAKPALLLGASEWTIVDAVGFAHAMATTAFEHDGLFVLNVLRKSKRASSEVPAGEHTMRPDFGAGQALHGMEPAYKSGWGGSTDGRFLVGQVGVAWSREQPFAFAVMFHPHQQPPRDDPGKTEGPRAIEAVLSEVARAVSKS